MYSDESDSMLLPFCYASLEVLLLCLNPISFISRENPCIKFLAKFCTTLSGTKSSCLSSSTDIKSSSSPVYCIRAKKAWNSML